VTSPDFVHPVVAAVFVYGVGGLGALGLVAVAWWFARRQAALAAAAEAAAAGADKRPAPGPATIFGVVVNEADDESERPVVRVSIRQRGKEVKRKRNWAVRWTEVARQTDAKPFLLRTAAGVEVGVEPGADVLLVDQMAETVLDGRDARRRVAAVYPGERVYVSGVLVGGAGGERGPYREEGRSRLVPAAGGRMLISSEPLTARHLRRQRLFRGVSMIGLGFFALAQVLFVSYHRLSAEGEVVQAEVVDSYRYVRRSRRNVRPGYAVKVRTPLGMLTSDVEPALFTQRPATLPFLVASAGTYVLGTEPTLPEGRVALIAVLAILLAIFVPAGILQSRDWWDRRLDERVAGRLG
jgi:hypothetical protein